MDLSTWSLVLAAVVLILFYFLDYYTYWKRRGIPCVKGLLPIVGHMLPVIAMRTNFSDLCLKIYREYKNFSMVGLYNMKSPVVLIREPALVKTVMQTSFTSFHENGLKIDPKLDPLLNYNPFFTYGERWVNGRKRLTYAFSSMRLKILFETVLGVTKKFEDFLERKLKASGKYELELKDLFSKYTGEVVANAGLGVEGLCFEDNPSTTSFQAMGKEFLDPNVSNGLVQALVFFAPQLNKIFKARFLPKKIDEFFRSIVKDVLENRRRESTPRNDFFQLMVDLEKTEGEKLDEEVLAAHALSFFVDGFETSSITLSFVGYQLAVHPEVQDKLRKEVMSVLANYDGKLTYESLKDMTYMDQVISESQRFYPAVGFLMKVCTQEYELKGSDGLSFQIKPGTPVIISTHGMQMDPQYWSEPEVFKPERFDNENKKDVEKFAFLPFGEGPRICVGMRMAILQMKACLATLVKSYSLELSPKTQLPLKLSPKHFLAAPEGGLWVHVKRI